MKTVMNPNEKLFKPLREKILKFKDQDQVTFSDVVKQNPQIFVQSNPEVNQPLDFEEVDFIDLDQHLKTNI